MIHSAATILVSAVMLVHGLFGCCWHHGHACEVKLAASANEEHGHSHGNDSQEDHFADGPILDNCSDHQDEHHDHPFQTCDEDQCTFIASGNVKLQDCSQSVAFDVYSLHCDQHAAAITQQGLMPASGFTASHLAQPLCAQPLTQVWLL